MPSSKRRIRGRKPKDYEEHRPFNWMVIYWANGSKCCALAQTIIEINGVRDSKYTPLW